ncbi:hypothetical protein PanWU01x14_351570 [Parasponia andersonii]|uniref:Uncharacterized protein n=1 Tax=Parasponia andersonii TaxID=3476 RepID=A0A2P5AAM3_PARAD|nr:hypothetical protein PanWU01x14_351570 [Parasponia andersonii]
MERKQLLLSTTMYAFENRTIEIYHASFTSSNAHQWLISMMQVITRPDIHHRANKQSGKTLAPLNKRSQGGSIV